jgi:hypothetical protein
MMGYDTMMEDSKIHKIPFRERFLKIGMYMVYGMQQTPPKMNL